ncbi:hypothetical protein EDB80DRAFT_642967 [Ilyonectria destructans]|nr:hypothetical protein EDB80DRAFT_642967 [Ilyonectria destructans]
MPSLDPALYTIAWIAPLEIESRAALCLFDKVHDGDFPLARGSDYVFNAGTVCGHQVVLATLPPGQPYGTGSAGALAGQVKMFFPNLWFGLLVGVAAGLPNFSRSPPRDIRLGDVLVALPEGDSAGLIAYELGREVGENTVQLLCGGHVLAKTETVIRSAIGKIKLKAPKDADFFLPHYQRIQHEEHANGTFVDPGQDRDVLYELDKAVSRPRRPDTRRTRVWYGPIGSGEKLMRDATRRNELRDQHGIIGLEMEAAGTMNTIPVGVIRGVCDYADSHKNKEWQPYAAAMAAAYAKAVLNIIQPKKVQEGHFMVPLGRNKGFVGRESILHQLLHHIPPSVNPDDCQSTVIEGLGGIGKTQVAIEAAYRVRDEHPDCSVFWVPAVNSISFENAYRDIGQKLKVQGIEEDKADVKALVKTALDRKMGSWLLIIDNADDMELLFGENGLSDYLPFNPTGSILFTTRNHEVTGGLDVSADDIILLAETNRSESMEMLQRSLKEDQTRDAVSTSSLLDFLTDLPLAIKQASAYMAKTGISTAQYLEYIQSSDKHLIELLSKDFNDRGRHRSTQNPVATTWLVSFQHISRDNPLAAQYLGFMSCLSEKEIPKSMLPPGNGELEIYEAIGTLKAHAFITERASNESYDIHRLVGLTMRNWIAEKGELKAHIISVTQRLDEIFPHPEHENKSLWVQYLPHALQVLGIRDADNSTDEADILSLIVNIAQCQSILGKYKESEAMHRRALNLSTGALGATHPDTLASMSNLAIVLHSQGKFEAAEGMHRRALDLHTEILGATHPNTVTSMNGLARLLDTQGKYEEAEAMQRRAFDLNMDILGTAHPNTLVSMSNLAHILGSQGKYEEAEAMYQQALDLSADLLGAMHPGTLIMMNSLAIMLHRQGKCKEADTIYRRALDLSTDALGAINPETLTMMNNLAIMLHQQGKCKEAEAIFRRALDLSTDVLGATHPETLIMMNNLAIMLHGQSKYKDVTAGLTLEF